MYKSSKFEEKDAQKVGAFMQAHPFITLIGFDGICPVATQVPVQVYQDEQGLRIVGHVMKKTDHHEAYARNENVLALFTGAHAYVSASVYENPAVASTWNYSSVQAKGKIRLMDEAETREVIKQLTNSYEDPATSKAAFHRMTDDYIEKNLKAISGFEIRVEHLANVFKLSQNHTETNRKQIIENLEQHGDADAQQVALEMKKRL
ncbi:FMN-binding negative transcriptional regulator [Pedobacter sp. KR3-3]|uniref:FMN-binding negative transcriptional regulator n=1 Tax=Pedobacter albus TaxID=3113905 RepID=A0ABU7I9M7_9SPHI|nr:FMN-binding negative transcriptional regulator [Pedobacter sp. KR3-3]MEE1946183.1 FMN-binding negative transcriptional regulator [Pedobacter sp. KR3-3]